MADTDDILPDDLGLPVQMGINSGAIELPTVAVVPATLLPNHADWGNGVADEATEGTQKQASPESDGTSEAVDMRSIEREHILQVLRNVNGSRRRAVELLGISERALRYKLKSYREEGHEIA
jgi:two-component system response regulator FlrC